MLPDDKCVILLTACVSPRKGIVYTKITDRDERWAQYCAALDFYLNKTPYKVVFCENTNCDMSADYAGYIESGKLEYLTFDGSNFDKSKGKGYGEAQIILHAVKYSEFIRRSKYVVKITGRVIVPNINKIIKSPLLRGDNLLRCNIAAADFLRSVIFVFTTATFPAQIKAVSESINDSGTPPKYFENALMDIYMLNPGVKLVPFMRSPKLCGVSATTGLGYKEKSNIDNIVDNLYYLRIVRRARDGKAPILLSAAYYAAAAVKKVMRIIGPKRK